MSSYWCAWLFSCTAEVVGKWENSSEARNSRKQKWEMQAPWAGICPRTHAPPGKVGLGHQTQSRQRKEKWKEELETLHKTKTHLEGRIPPKFLKGGTSRGKRPSPQRQCVCGGGGLYGFWPGRQDKPYKDSPENEILEAWAHMPYMAKKKKEK